MRVIGGRRAGRCGVMAILLAFAFDAGAHDYGRIELIRDTWGVPHIFAVGDAGAMYGAGYAAAEDRAFQMYYNLRIIQGRLAEVLGDVVIGATPTQPQGRIASVRHDIEMRTIGYWHYAQQVADGIDPRTRALLQAYSDGVNAYIAGHPDDLHYLFSLLEIEPEAWTPAACIASWWRLSLFFAGDGLRDGLDYYAIADGSRKVRKFAADEPIGPELLRGRDETSVIQRPDVSDAWLRKVNDYARKHDIRRALDITPLDQRPGPRFSHAWAVGRSRTTDGSAVLVSDPQTPVRNPSLFHEFHIRGKTFNARGIGVPGSPGILIGFTDKVAWGLTALGADQADLFMLATDPNRPNQYLYDNQWCDMDVHTETIAVQDASPRTITIRRTHLGPVVTAIAPGLRPGHEAALKRIPICETDRDTFQGVLAMIRAKDVRQFREALAGWRFPSANCVFADTRGRIGYQTIFALPVRSPRALNEGSAAHQGDSSDYDWQGFVPNDLLPHVIDPPQGWIVTANHRPVASFYPLPLGISTGSLGDTERSWRLKERMALKDKFSPADVLDVHYDTVNPIKRDLVKFGYHLRDTLKTELDPETILALDYLKHWYAAGARFDSGIAGAEIVTLMPMAFRQNFEAATIYGGGLSGLSAMCGTIGSRIAEDPNAPLTGPEAEYVDLIIRAAWRYGKANYGDDPNQWQARAQGQLTASKLDYFSTLDGLPSLDPRMDLTYPPLKCTDGGTILSQKAQSYTQFVTLGNVDESQALLPIGQSEHPHAMSRLAAYDLWSQGRLRPAPISRKAVETTAASRQDL